MAAIWIAALAGCIALATPDVPSPATSSAPAPSASSKVATIRAQVTALDLQSRMLTLKGLEGTKGRSVTIKVRDDVRELDQVKVGDILTVTYSEAVAVEVAKQGAEPGSKTKAIDTTKPGELPTGMVLNRRTVEGTVQRIGPKNESLTVQLADGGSITVRMEGSTARTALKKGDRVWVTYTDALAVAVQRESPSGKPRAQP